MMEKSNNKNSMCCICMEIESHEFPIVYQEYYPVRNRICLENQDFFVVPSVSPIVDGHLLIFSKSHIRNLACIDETKMKSFLEIVYKTISFVSYCYGNYFIFEHGVGTDGFTGCGIDHAHLHILPLDSVTTKKIIDKANERLTNFFRGNLLEILPTIDNKKSYLLYGMNLGLIQYTISNEIPSQFFRQMISKALNKNIWDWNKYYGIENFIKTYNSFNNFNSQFNI